ncbi:MAG: hypothetical protein A4E57_04783 [Syntrophorhabdaceae bacterium PtaU1.Bin034]|nr:MAG: hypothetical protein A4E57_04783 [Syntrophorhabdaceae bacterium PtaU1.Bin034]
MPFPRAYSFLASAWIFALSVKGSMSFAARTVLALQSSSCTLLSVSDMASIDLMTFEQGSQRFFKARSKAAAGAAWRIR